jgi:hypothetical protein
VASRISQAIAIQNVPDAGGDAVPVAIARPVKTTAEVVQWIVNAAIPEGRTRWRRSRMVDPMRASMPTNGTA